MVYWDVIDSPIGPIYLAAVENWLVYCGSTRVNGIDMHTWLDKHLPGMKYKKERNKVLGKAVGQLEPYFKGESKTLDVPVKLIGTEFRKKVWKALQTIPYGESRTYGEIAKQIGNEKATRAVGQANNQNPISYFVP